MIDRDELIQAVASKYGVILSPDDPIFHYLFMHDAVLDQYRGMLAQQFLELQAGIDTTNKQQYEQARVLWERLANRKVQVLEAVGDKMVADMEVLLERQRLLFEASQGEFLRRVQWIFLFGGCSVIVLILGIIVTVGA